MNKYKICLEKPTRCPVTPPTKMTSLTTRVSHIAQWQSTPTGNLERSWVRFPLGTRKIFFPSRLYKTYLIFIYYHTSYVIKQYDNTLFMYTTKDALTAKNIVVRPKSVICITKREDKHHPRHFHMGGLPSPPPPPRESRS